jgi:hypothetical protein
VVQDVIDAGQGEHPGGGAGAARRARRAADPAVGSAGAFLASGRGLPGLHVAGLFGPSAGASGAAVGASAGAGASSAAGATVSTAAGVSAAGASSAGSPGIAQGLDDRAAPRWEGAGAV